MHLHRRHLTESDENDPSIRKPFSPLEATAIGKALEELERPKAKERVREGGIAGGKSPIKGSVKFTEPCGETRDKVGAAIGVSGVTYQRMKAVSEAAQLPGARAPAMIQVGKFPPASRNRVYR